MCAVAAVAAVAAAGVAGAEEPPTLVLRWGTTGTGNGQFRFPSGIGIGADGSVYVVDGGNHRIQMFTADGVFITKWGSQGSADGQFDFPRDIAVDAYGDVYVADGCCGIKPRIQKFTGSGTHLETWTHADSISVFVEHKNLVFDAAGTTLYVSGTPNILKYDTEGTLVGGWNTGFGPTGFLNGLAVAPGGEVYVAVEGNPGDDFMAKFAASGSLITTWGHQGPGDGEFQRPLGVALDAGENVYVSEGVGGRVQKFTSGGAWLTSWIVGGAPVDLAFGPDGSLFVVDENRNFISKYADVPTNTVPTTWGRLKSLYGR